MMLGFWWDQAPYGTGNILFLINHLMEDGKGPGREVVPFFFLSFAYLANQAQDLEGLGGVPGEPA